MSRTDWEYTRLPGGFITRTGTMTLPARRLDIRDCLLQLILSGGLITGTIPRLPAWWLGNQDKQSQWPKGFISVKFYHATSEAAWKLIQEEGILWGLHSYRYTYLTPLKEIAIGFGGESCVLLEVKYDPHGVGVTDENGEVYDNYGFDPPEGMICWQFSVFKPISTRNVRRVVACSEA